MPGPKPGALPLGDSPLISGKISAQTRFFLLFLGAHNIVHHNILRLYLTYDLFYLAQNKLELSLTDPFHLIGFTG
jgi:hypothetical protein